MGNYREALNDYNALKTQSEDSVIVMNISICMFYLGTFKAPNSQLLLTDSGTIHVFIIYMCISGMYNESLEIVDEMPNNPLKVRLLFHLAHKLNDEDRLLDLHGSLRDTAEGIMVFTIYIPLNKCRNNKLPFLISLFDI